MRIVKRILIGTLALVLGLVVVLAGVVALDAFTGPKTADYTNTTFTAVDGSELIGYLAQPEGDGPHAAVLMLHEWWGLNEEITVLADAMAAEGYVVLVPDAYRGRVTSLVPRALWMRLTTPEETIHADIDAALDYLLSQPNVDPARVASLGFCFGGEQSLQLALRQPEPLAATVIYYGSLVTEASALAPLTQAEPVLGIFGAEDQQIPVSEVNAFEAALAQAGINHEVTIYDGVGHAFVTAENYNESGAGGEAWQQAVAFLNENVGGDGR